MDACIAKGRVTRIVQTHSPRSSPRDTLPSPVRSVKTSASRERSRRAMAGQFALTNLLWRSLDRYPFDGLSARCSN
jgi:hypothetical protein